MSLCSRTDVRLQMETKGTDTQLDALIDALLPVATARIIDEVERELDPVTSSATRMFQASGHLVELAPYDLRAATAVVLDPNGSAKTLTANADYKLLPLGADKWGVYTELRISDYIDVDTAKLRFGLCEVQISGSWGFATVPDIAKQAAVLTIRAWLRRDALRGAYTDLDMSAVAPDPGAYYALSPAARSMLMPLRRFATV